MAEQFSSLTDAHAAFIARQQVFFVGTACADGPINVSPKGMDSLRVLDPGRVAWLNLTGSGNETATHVRDDGRMTLMFCSFDWQPLILRLYGHARVVHPRDAASVEPVLLTSIAERNRLYQAFLDAKKRHDTAPH